MGVLALDYAFGELKLRKVIGHSFVSNEVSVRYHKRLGFREIEEKHRRVRKNGKMQDMVRLEVTAECWQSLRPSVGQWLMSEVKA